MAIIGPPKPPSGGGGSAGPQPSRSYVTDPARIPSSHIVERSFTQLLGWVKDFKLYEPPSTGELLARIRGYSPAAAARLARVEQMTRERMRMRLGDLSPAAVLDQLGLDALAVYQDHLVGFDVTTNPEAVVRKLTAAAKKRPVFEALGVRRLVVVQWYVDKAYHELTPDERDLLGLRLRERVAEILAKHLYENEVFLTLE